MLPKKITHIFPNFLYLAFKTLGVSIVQIFFRTNLSFFFPLNSGYVYQNQHLLKKFNRFFLKSFSIHWVRVSFRGKGYRLRKFKKFNRLTLNFGHSHWTRLILTESFFFKKIKRQNYICLINSFYKLNCLKHYIKFIKKLNSYTKRGLRLRRQFIRKRFGKISQVVSSLH